MLHCNGSIPSKEISFNLKTQSTDQRAVHFKMRHDNVVSRYCTSWRLLEQTFTVIQFTWRSLPLARKVSLILSQLKYFSVTSRCLAFFVLYRTIEYKIAAAKYAKTGITACLIPTPISVWKYIVTILKGLRCV